MSRRFRFRQVDVFTDTPLHGNPLAVFTDAEHGQGDAPTADETEMRPVPGDTDRS